MTEIETLTDEERETIGSPGGWALEAKLLRITDAQGARIAELEAKVQAAEDKLTSVRRIVDEAQAGGGWVYWQALHLALEGKL